MKAVAVVEKSDSHVKVRMDVVVDVYRFADYIRAVYGRAAGIDTTLSTADITSHAGEERNLRVGNFLLVSGSATTPVQEHTARLYGGIESKSHMATLISALERACQQY